MFQNRSNGQSCFNNPVTLKESGFNSVLAMQKTSRDKIYTNNPANIDLKLWRAANDYVYIFQVSFFCTAEHVFNASQLINAQFCMTYLEHI